MLTDKTMSARVDASAAARMGALARQQSSSKTDITGRLIDPPGTNDGGGWHRAFDATQLTPVGGCVLIVDIMMCVDGQGFRARRCMRFGWAIAAALLLPPFALAHTSLEHYVREGISISVGAANIDIKIQFSFPADLSLAERQRMNRDGDGKLSRDETASYLKNIQARAEQLLRLTVNGQAVTLIPLRDPVLDLGDAPGVEAHPHELNLAYFARMPKDFGVGGTIALDSGLWADAPLMVSAATEAAKGIRFHAADTQGLRPPSTDGAMLRITEARCTQWESGSNKNGRQP